MLKWYPRLSESKDGLLNHQNPTTDSLIVCHEGVQFRKFGMFNYVYQFANYLISQTESERCFFEVIRGTSSQKPYFDIDISDGKITEKQSVSLISALKRSILDDTRINEDDILVFSSHGTDKLSYHVIVDRWCLPDYQSNKKYCNNIIEKVLSPYKHYIDSLVYKSIQQLRTFGSTKRGKDRTKILVGQNLKKDSKDYRFDFISTLLRSLVSNTSSCRILEYTIPTKKVYDGPAEALTESEIEAVKSLEIISLGIFEIMEIKDRLISLKRLKASYCEICKRDHENENPYLIVTQGEIHFHCRRTKDDRIIIWRAPALESNRVNTTPSKHTPPKEIKTGEFVKKFLGK